MQKDERPVSQWSNEEIQTALVSLGGAAMPVTPTTRPLLERKLEKLLFKKDPGPSKEESKERSVHSEAVAAVGSSRSEDASDEGYYGVVVDSEVSAGHALSPFYTKRSDALKAIKNIPGARFKRFNDPSSAETFSNSPGSCSRSNSPSSTGRPSPAIETSSESVSVSEKPNQFPSLKTQDLNKLKRVVERGDIAAFSQVVWANPRYLVNCYGDSPEILQGGFRYNALHCAVRVGQLEICKAGFCYRYVYTFTIAEHTLYLNIHACTMYVYTVYACTCTCVVCWSH